MGEIVEVDEKGSIVIPITIREKLGIREGTQLVVATTSDQITISRIQVQPAEEDPQELKTFLGTRPKTKNL